MLAFEYPHYISIKMYCYARAHSQMRFGNYTPQTYMSKGKSFTYYNMSILILSSNYMRNIFSAFQKYVLAHCVKPKKKARAVNELDRVHTFCMALGKIVRQSPPLLVVVLSLSLSSRARHDDDDGVAESSFSILLYVFLINNI